MSPKGRQLARAGTSTTERSAPLRWGPDFNRRISELATLKDGWYDGDGIAFDPQSLSRLRSVIDEMLTAHDIPAPYLYPTPQGEINAEWTLGDWEVEITFDRAMAKPTALATNSRTREKEEIEVALDAASAASRLGSFVERHRTPGLAS